MATYTKRKTSNGQTRWRVRVRKHGYPDLTKTFRTKDEARLWATHQESQINSGKSVPTIDQFKRTLSDLITRFIDEVLPVRDQNKDRKKTASLLRYWQGELGSVSLIHLTPDMIAKCRDQLAKRVKKPTVNRYLAALGATLKHARKEWRWMTEDPMRDVTRFSEAKTIGRVLNDRERSDLLEECEKNPDLYLAVFLALSTGMRRSEIRQLTWGRVNLDEGFVHLIDTKNGEARNVPLTSKALELMDKRRILIEPESVYVFPSKTKTTAPWDWRHVFRTAVANVGLEGLRFHDLRHCAASYLAMSGCSASEIASILGHKTLVMAQRYTHIADQHNKDNLKRMNERFL